MSEREAREDLEFVHMTNEEWADQVTETQNKLFRLEQDGHRRANILIGAGLPIALPAPKKGGK